jgi:intein-encoded DNA endonuclease-like protein
MFGLNALSNNSISGFVYNPRKIFSYFGSGNLNFNGFSESLLNLKFSITGISNVSMNYIMDSSGELMISSNHNSHVAYIFD